MFVFNGWEKAVIFACGLRESRVYSNIIELLVDTRYTLYVVNAYTETPAIRELQVVQ